MTRRLARRGPDGEGLVVRGPIVLGHRRLAVIDPTPEGLQPMSSHDGRFWVVFNGEIYNYQELRSQLERLGGNFRTATDTEVILEAYRRWGDDCVRELNGMFAFALWDEVEQRLLLARDRLGEKPLYYQPLQEGGLVFASGLKALRLHPAVRRELNPVALGQYLSLSYIPGTQCIRLDVRKLPPGTLLVAKRGHLSEPRTYWDLAHHFREKRRFRSEEEAAEELGALLQDCVRLRLVSDVPLGAFLSGGVDSSIVVAAMSRLRDAEFVRTFTMGFGEASYDEVPAARETATLLGTTHTDQVTDANIATTLPEIVGELDEPFADTSIVPMYHLAKFTRRHVTVALSGDGGDEIFAGYVTYAADRLKRITSWLPGTATRVAARVVDRLLPVSFDKVSFDYKLRRFISGHSLPPAQAHVSWREILSGAARGRLVRRDLDHPALGADVFPSFAPHFEEVRDCHYLDQSMYVDIKTWLADDILVKVDQATMAHGLEARVPLLDHRLVEFAASLPIHWKLRGFRSKYLLKASQRRHLPRRVLHRAKKGFNAPVSHWLAGPLQDLARSATHSPAVLEWLDAGEIDGLWKEHQSRSADHGLALFALTVLGLWLEEARCEQA